MRDLGYQPPTSASDLRYRPPLPISDLRPPPPTSASDLRYRPPTSATDLRYRPPPPTSASDLRLRPPLPTSDLRYRPPPTSATDLRRCTNIWFRWTHQYGLVRARMAVQGIAILKILCMTPVIRNFQNLLCAVCEFFVCTVWWWNILCRFDQECKLGCEEEEQRGMFLNVVWADWQKHLHLYLSGSVMVTIESQWYSTAPHCDQGTSTLPSERIQNKKINWTSQPPFLIITYVNHHGK